ncbi:MAG: hemerythrin domain-containing protein [Gallionella sp.]|jgi:hemerythrin-like domain-containing protein
MTRLISAEAAPGFDHPLQMLRACHEKILRQCDTLQKLTEYLISKGCDAQARQAALGILRYFDTAGQFHHQDEELDLFPALRAATNSVLLDRLLCEHALMLASWDALRPTLQLIAEGLDVTLDAALTEKFIDSYRDHIAIENTELLPLASGMLSLQQMEQIGRKMAARRGAKFPDPIDTLR